MKKLKPITPGEFLAEEFLKPMGITQYRLAKEVGVPAQRIGDIVMGKRAVSADTGVDPVPRTDWDLILKRWRWWWEWAWWVFSVRS